MQWFRGLTGLVGAVVVAATVSGCVRQSQPAVPVDASSVYRVSAPLVNLLACPSLTCTVLEDLGTGQEVAVLAVIPGGWLMVRVLSTGQEGYVLGRFLSRP
ncbi:SH3 domain-containing protein [Solidesulfovibrio sp.]